jgi:Amidohydrolase
VCPKRRLNQKRYKLFWERLAALDLPLLAHTGGEFCVRSIRHDLKSPACLRLPLERGMTVIAAHCGTRALPWDGDHFQTFLEMRDRYPNLYGDLSPLSHIKARIMKMGADLPCACVGLSEAVERGFEFALFELVFVLLPIWCRSNGSAKIQPVSCTGPTIQ